MRKKKEEEKEKNLKDQQSDTQAPGAPVKDRLPSRVWTRRPSVMRWS